MANVKAANVSVLDWVLCSGECCCCRPGRRFCRPAEVRVASLRLAGGRASRQTPPTRPGACACDAGIPCLALTRPWVVPVTGVRLSDIPAVTGGRRSGACLFLRLSVRPGRGGSRRLSVRASSGGLRVPVTGPPAVPGTQHAHKHAV